MVGSFLGGAAGGVVGRAVLEIVTDSKGAERSLTQFQKRLAVGSGTLKDGAAVLRDWRDRAAGAGGGVPPGSRTSGFESLAVLQAANERARAVDDGPQMNQPTHERAEGPAQPPSGAVIDGGAD